MTPMPERCRSHSSRFRRSRHIQSTPRTSLQLPSSQPPRSHHTRVERRPATLIIGPLYDHSPTTVAATAIMLMMVKMYWFESDRCDPMVRPLADRHYNRQSIGAKNFAPPGSCYVLTTVEYGAYWISSWPFAEYVKHAWAGAWICTASRNDPNRHPPSSSPRRHLIR